ncbi:MAG: hypothetical protein M3P18_11145 [Actinomycetota bacterium]|nr:hypothetical protein [Actinomycetota bacterium]
MSRISPSAGRVRVATLVATILVCAAGGSVSTFASDVRSDQSEFALTVPGEGGYGVTIDRGRVAVGTEHALRIWWPRTGRVVRFPGGFVGPDHDVVLSGNLVAWTSSEQGQECNQEVYLADLSSRRRALLAATGGQECPDWTFGGGNAIFLEAGPLWRIAPSASSSAAKRCPDGHVRRCIFVTDRFTADGVDGNRILAERKSKGHQFVVLSSAGHVLQELPPISHEGDKVLHGQTIYTQRGRTLTRYDIRRRRTTGRWIVGQPSDLVYLIDLSSSGFVVYQLYDTDKILLLRLRDGRQARMPIPRSPDYKFWDVDGAAFGDGGLYYQYTEKLDTGAQIIDRSIVRFIPRSRFDSLFKGG